MDAMEINLHYLTFLYCCPTDTVTANLQHPELNDGFRVHRFHQAEAQGNLANGFHITTDCCELGDVLEGRVKMVLLPAEPDTVLWEKAAIPYSYRNHFEGVYLPTLTRRGDPIEEDILNVEKARRAQIMANPTRWKKWTKIKFPPNVRLSNEVFTPNAINGQIAPLPIPYTLPVHRVAGNQFPWSVVQINWRVTLEASQQPLQHREQNENMAEEAMIRMMAGAGI